MLTGIGKGTLIKNFNNSIQPPFTMNHNNDLTVNGGFFMLQKARKRLFSIYFKIKI